MPSWAWQGPRLPLGYPQHDSKFRGPCIAGRKPRLAAPSVPPTPSWACPQLLSLDLHCPRARLQCLTGPAPGPLPVLWPHLEGRPHGAPGPALLFLLQPWQAAWLCPKRCSSLLRQPLQPAAQNRGQDADRASGGGHKALRPGARPACFFPSPPSQDGSVQIRGREEQAGPWASLRLPSTPEL